MMFEKHVQPVLHWFKQVVTEPRGQLDRGEKTVRYMYELGIHGWKALQKDNATQMAAALAFRTLFALLPVLVVSAVFVKGLRGPDEFKHLVRTVIHAVGIDALRISSGELAAGPKSQPAIQSASQPVATTPADHAAAPDSHTDAGPTLDVVIENLSSTDLSALGWVGMLLVVYSAISLMVTIENSFNAIYGAPQGRGWVWRVLIYWAVLSLGPAFIGLTVYVDGLFGNLINGVHTWKWLLNGLKFTWGLSVAWLLMFSVYRLLPNTRVTSRAAMIGGFVAALLLQGGKSSMVAYVQGASSLQSLSGYLGFLPILMFWTYLMWLVVLFGLEVSATIQMLQGRGFEEIEDKRPQNGLVDPASVLAVMEIVTERFIDGQSTSTRQISEETLAPEGIVCRIVDRLVESNLLLRVEHQEDTVSLSRPPEQISASQLIDIGFHLVDEGGTGRPSALIERLREAQRTLAQHSTLATLLQAGAKPAQVGGSLS